MNCTTYSPRADTMYHIGKDRSVSPCFIFHYGKYKKPVRQSEIVPSDDTPYITLTKPTTTSNFFFMDCYFSIYAPEPFMKAVTRMGETRTVEITNVYAIFDKRTGRLHLMKQPESGVLGLLNDLDNGIAFWPKAISANGTEVVMLCPAADFIDTYSRQENPPEDVKRILRSIDEESNPVAIIARLKE